MSPVCAWIEIVHQWEVNCLAYQGLLEILFGNAGLNFFYPFFLQFLAFCFHIIWLILVYYYIHVHDYINEFGMIFLLFFWIVVWNNSVRTLRYVDWLRAKKGDILNSHFVRVTLPAWKLWLGQYISYYSAYKNISKNSIDLKYKSLGGVQKTKPENRIKILPKGLVDWLNSGSDEPVKPVNWDKIFPLASIIQFIYTLLVYLPNAFKYGHRKQSYFRNYFNSKRRFNNWIWKWRK